MRNRAASRPLPLAALGLAVALGACQPIVDNQGQRAVKEDVEQIQVGRSNKNDVARLLGSPSSVAPLDANTWYYMSVRREHYAFFEPRVREHQVLMIRFNQAGVVAEIKGADAKDRRNVAVTDRTTPTRGGEPGFLRTLYDTILRGPVSGREQKTRPGPE
jgi:outer membrane protein assembly factor BamE (lipoprotein component of BamABCDE complex)